MNWNWVRSSLLTPFSLVLISFLATCVCADDLPPILLTGKVVDATGKGIAGAEVVLKLWNVEGIKADPTKTEGDGSFRLMAPNSVTNRVFGVVLATAPTGEMRFIEFNSAGDSIETLNLVVKPTRRFEVTALDQDGRAVEGADVHFIAGFRQIVEGKTDLEGHWIASVPADAKTWRVYAKKSKVGFDYAQ